MGLKPTRNHVIVRQEKKASFKSDIIVQSDAHREYAGEGVVEAIGKLEHQAEISVGDHVLFPKYAGTKLSDDRLLLVYWDIDAVMEA